MMQMPLDSKIQSGHFSEILGCFCDFLSALQALSEIDRRFHLWARASAS
jgi:hypothetical protein